MGVENDDRDQSVGTSVGYSLTPTQEYSEQFVKYGVAENLGQLPKTKGSFFKRNKNKALDKTRLGTGRASYTVQHGKGKDSGGKENISFLTPKDVVVASLTSALEQAEKAKKELIKSGASGTDIDQEMRAIESSIKELSAFRNKVLLCEDATNLKDLELDESEKKILKGILKPALESALVKNAKTEKLLNKAVKNKGARRVSNAIEEWDDKLDKVSEALVDMISSRGHSDTSQLMAGLLLLATLALQVGVTAIGVVPYQMMFKPYYDLDLKPEDLEKKDAIQKASLQAQQEALEAIESKVEDKVTVPVELPQGALEEIPEQEVTPEQETAAKQETAPEQETVAKQETAPKQETTPEEKVETKQQTAPQQTASPTEEQVTVPVELSQDVAVSSQQKVAPEKKTSSKQASGRSVFGNAFSDRESTKGTAPVVGSETPSVEKAPVHVFSAAARDREQVKGAAPVVGTETPSVKNAPVHVFSAAARARQQSASTPSNPFRFAEKSTTSVSKVKATETVGSRVSTAQSDPKADPKAVAKFEQMLRNQKKPNNQRANAFRRR